MTDDEIDVELVAAWLAGDPKAADAIVDRHFDALLGYSKLRRYRDLDPEEAVQNVFLKLIQKVGLWDPLGGSLRSWLMTILGNELRGAYRDRQLLLKHSRRLAGGKGASYTHSFESPCDQHDGRWFQADVLLSVKGVLGRLRPERSSFLLKPAVGFACADRAALSRARRQIARNLALEGSGPQLTLRVARELILARECGKLPQELFE